MIEVTVARADSPLLRAGLLDGVYQLRCRVFRQRLGWEVQVRAGRERDHFDELRPLWVVAHDLSRRSVHGCCRLLPSQGPNMLRDVFPSLLDGAPIPAGERLWEVSRFAVDSTTGNSPGFGFGQVPIEMLRSLFGYAAAEGVEALIGVTSAGFARLLRGLGLRFDVLGRPRRIGDVLSLAFHLPIDRQALDAVAAEPSAWLPRRAA
ncbi:acyl-homoserine-lactone synthase [Pseudomarimonas arenosa]|uniref:Acyl-homoserine-lactone synthase n=1 Tax=Pseudomarimonas arenosa TaxID=2774145 RepID=A0AAW3ZQW8_9GAMM|nr:acyl-homoserine-lactone synthase [Pseudomarimonas arenosa]MBD8526676.1 GNAT family N-acetyltransferase [Pseudomarimonas arenosa]